MYRQSIAALFLSCLAVLPFQASANESPRPVAQPAEQTQQQSVQINLNTASAEALEAGLLGIGPSKAKAIIEHRNGNGPFASVDELLEVKGIGPATLERNRDRLSVN